MPSPEVAAVPLPPATETGHPVVYAEDSPSEGVNPVRAIQEQIEASYQRRRLTSLEGGTTVGNCLKPLLAALGWTGEERELHEALPYLEPVADLNALRAVLARLGFTSRYRQLNLSQISSHMLPCLFVDISAERYLVLLSIEEDGRLLVFDAAANGFRTLPAAEKAGSVYIFSPTEEGIEAQLLKDKGWVQSLLSKFSPAFKLIFPLTFLINALALGVPLYIMGVYDRAIGASSPLTLAYLLGGILIVVVAEFGMRRARGYVIAYLGARFESLVSRGTFEQILYLPIGMTESASIPSQTTRLKQFESTRDLFGSALASSLLDLPFVLVFLALIFIIGGAIGFVPLALLVLFLTASAVTMPMTRGRLRRASEAQGKLRSFLSEVASRNRVIRSAGAEDIWIARFEKILGREFARSYDSQQFSIVLQAVSQALVMVTGVLSVFLGTLMVLDGRLSTGALLAIVALVWRLVSPLQAVFLGLHRIGSVAATFKQVNALMGLQAERRPASGYELRRTVRGHISFSGVGFRHTSSSEPALRGLSVDIKPGEVVAVTGDSGSGKSTMLKIALGLYQPQIGVVRVDGLDIRQLNPGEFRRLVSYLPQRPEFFYGTIRQNLLLADPSASEDAIHDAIRSLGAAHLFDSLPEGLNTRLTSTSRDKVPSGFLQQLALVRAFIKNAPIYMLDEPGSRLDHAGDTALVRKLEELRGRATTLVVTHRPSHMRVADRVIVLKQGTVVADGKPDAIVSALPGLTRTQDIG